MTPNEAIRDELASRTRLINDTDAEIRSLLRQAADEVSGILARQPTDYQQWYLPQLETEIRGALGRWGDEAAAAAGNGQTSAWRAGERLVTRVLQVARISAVVPRVIDTQLRAMTAFTTSKIKGITLDAANKINTQLGLVVIGAATPFDAASQVQSILGEDTRRRATVVVHNELARAYSTANQLTMATAAEAVPGMQKRWVRSAKRHPRETHAMIHGQIRDVDKPFNLPPDSLEIMYPHDPAAPIEETINCGCVAVPHVPGWKSTLPAKAPDDADGVALSKLKPPKAKPAKADDVEPPAAAVEAPPLRRALRDARRRIATEQQEHALVMGSDGRVLLEKTGEHDRVTFTKAEAALMRDAVVLHNHPGIPASFSKGDIRTAMVQGVAEMHVVDKDFHYVLRPPQGGWSAALWKKVEPAYDKIEAQIVARFEKALQDGFITEEQFDARLDDVIVEQLSTRFGLRYKRRARSSNER